MVPQASQFLLLLDPGLHIIVPVHLVHRHKPGSTDPHMD